MGHPSASLVLNAMLGALAGFVIAASILLTDTLGLASLIKSGPEPVMVASLFMLGGSIILTPFVWATALVWTDPKR